MLNTRLNNDRFERRGPLLFEFPVRESFCQSPPTLAEAARQVAAEVTAVRKGVDAIATYGNLARIAPYVYGQERSDSSGLMALLLDFPEQFSVEGLRELREASQAKLASLPAQRRSMEFRSETRAVGDRRVKFIVSRSSVIDRHGSRILTDGIDLTNFKRNPVFIWSHDGYGGGFSTPALENVIGKAINYRQDREILELEIEFFTGDINPKSEQALRLVKAGGLQATSIGFIPKEVKSEIVDGREIPVITKSELLEASLVTIPSNPGVEITGGRATNN